MWMGGAPASLSQPIKVKRFFVLSRSKDHLGVFFFGEVSSIFLRESIGRRLISAYDRVDE